jgi:hypothetical protein
MANDFNLDVDPDNQRLVFVQVKDDGSWDLTKGVINLDLRDVENKQASFLRIHFTDTSGVKKFALGLASGPVDDTTSGPSDAANSPDDLWIGGGGGGGSSVQRFRIKAVHEDYLTCRTYGDRQVKSATVHAGAGGAGYSVGQTFPLVGGTGAAAILSVTAISGGGSTGPIATVSVTNGGLYTADPPTSACPVNTGAATFDLVMQGGEGTTDVLVAKPRELRHPAAGNTETEKVENVTWTHSYVARANNSDIQRNSTATGKLPEVHIVEPVYKVNANSDGYSEIYADQPAGGTGVAVAGVALTWMDTNRPGRVWVQIG